MGVERPVVRWHIQRQLLLYKIAALETQLTQLTAQNIENSVAEEQASTQDTLATAREELNSLGPCPRPMMG